jgi:signal transduction histidine kinase
VPIQVGVEDEIISEMVTTEMFFGFYAGLLIAMIVYNLFIFLTVKDKSYLFYVVYIIFICINQLTLCGFTSKYLWPDSEWMALQSVNLTSCLGSINAILFMQVFLQVKTNLPRQNPILNVLISLFVIVIFVSILGFIHTSFQIMQLITLVGSVYMLFIGYKISQNGYRPARFYMYAWSILLLGVIIFVLKDFEIIPYNDFTAYTVQYASGVEVVLLSFALGDRINILEKEKQESRAQAILVLEENERIIREQNIILESKVKERTSELQSANKELNRTLKNLKEAQAQLVHSEKMASLGQLTAGIAHEINNPINFVTSSINPLKRDLDFINQIITSAEAFLQEDDKQKRIQNMETLLEDMDYTYLVEEINMLLQGIQEGSTRTSEIVKSLKNFSRLDETDIKKANIIEGIESTLLLLNSSISDAKIQIKKQFNPIPNTTCQPGKLNQVYMNILNNAIYAVKANTQRKEIGIITINTKEENNSILIEIKDNGIGMSAKTKEKLFEPFFTTKDVGEGTGLGLSIVYSIIESHEGKIEVDSELEVGTTFTITLPIK